MLSDPDMLRLNALNEHSFSCWGVYGCTQVALTLTLTLTLNLNLNLNLTGICDILV